MKNFGRILSGLTSPLGVVLVILFFLPWIQISCQNTKLATQTGWQLALGQTTVEENSGVEKDEKADDDGEPDRRLGYLLGLAVPAAIVVVGLLGLAGKLTGPGAGVLLALLAAGGIVVMIFATMVDYGDEIQADAKQQSAASNEGQSDDGTSDIPPEVLAGVISTRPLAAVWVSLVLYIVVLLCGGLAMAAPLMRSAARAGPPPAGP